MTSFTLTGDPLIAIRNDGVECRTDLPFYQEWLTSGGIPTPADTKAPILKKARETRDKIFLRLNGIQQDIEYNVARGLISSAVAIPQIDGIIAAKDGLKGITTHTTVAAAVDGIQAIAAIKVRYSELVAALCAASPYACTSFNGLDV